MWGDMDRLAILDQLSELGTLEMLRGRKRWCFIADDGFHSRLARLLPGEERNRLLHLSKLASFTPDHVDGFDVAVICTNGSEDLPRGTIVKRLGLRPLRLFADLILRRAAGISLRTSAEPQQEARPGLQYAILCLPRCGSTLLAKELELAGFGQPKEHLRAPIATLLQHRTLTDFSLERWWALVRSGSSQNNVFGTKIIFDFLSMAAEQMQDDELRWFMGELRAMAIIRILRRNKVDQVVSDYVARKTGVWHLWDDSIKAGYSDRLEAVSANLQELTALYRKFMHNEERLDRMLRDAGIVPIDVDYAALSTQPKATVASIAEQLGRAVPEGYMDSPLTLEPTRTPFHERLSAELAAAVAQRDRI